MENTPNKTAWSISVPPFFVAILLTFALISGYAAESASDQESQTEKLAKETQNPVANLISVPFQNNFNFGIGPNDATQWNLNVEPVIPISLNKDWNLITRTIMPIINQPSPAPGIGSAFGLGDINPHGVPLTGEFRQTDLGRWTDDDISHGDRTAARQRQVERRTLPCGIDHAGALGDRGSGEQPMVFCGVEQEERGRTSCPAVH
jgi:hypothetical protein